MKCDSSSHNLQDCSLISLYISTWKRRSSNYLCHNENSVCVNAIVGYVVQLTALCLWFTKISTHSTKTPFPPRVNTIIFFHQIPAFIIPYALTSAWNLDEFKKKKKKGIALIKIYKNICTVEKENFGNKKSFLVSASQS